MREFNIFRVRKSFDNLKSQKGAFFIFENALKCAIKTKRNIYDNNKICVFNYKEFKKGAKAL